MINAFETMASMFQVNDEKKLRSIVVIISDDALIYIFISYLRMF